MSQKPKFEKQMERLQVIVDELEKGDLPLEKGVQLYTEGRALAVACRKQLEEARIAVTVREENGVAAFPEQDEQDRQEETE